MSTRMEKLKCTFNYTATTTTHVILGRRLISNTTATASLQSLQLYEHTPLGTQARSSRRVTTRVNRYMFTGSVTTYRGSLFEIGYTQV